MLKLKCDHQTNSNLGFKPYITSIILEFEVFFHEYTSPGGLGNVNVFVKCQEIGKILQYQKNTRIL